MQQQQQHPTVSPNTKVNKKIKYAPRPPCQGVEYLTCGLQTAVCTHWLYDWAALNFVLLEWGSSGGGDSGGGGVVERGSGGVEAKAAAAEAGIP